MSPQPSYTDGLVEAEALGAGVEKDHEWVDTMGVLKVVVVVVVVVVVRGATGAGAGLGR